ncbi:s1 RNA-binding domain-containing protein 1 [Trichonephila clavata]|uniref:S1 RNA-binding domain-containing protein 1 n=1 Tax=Trichonephila clavata TaxID=2740835 RepID=A0A8X6F6X4_TRICU|nr:s1 RNA-binding domain-containing protein 1 [Trichonephila clavata]
MDLPQKRKRTTRIIIEQDEDDDESLNISDEDEEYTPASKKKKTEFLDTLKNITKPKEQSKPKTVRKKNTSNITKSRPRKKILKNANDTENNEQIPFMDDEVIAIPSTSIDNGELEKPLPQHKKSDAELERIASEAIQKAKQSFVPWCEEEVVAQTCCISLEHARNIITLLKQDCTIPFIVRYRKQMTGGMQAENLREVQESYDEVKQVQKKVDTILKTIKHEKFDEAAATSFLNAKSLNDLEMLYAPFKPGSKKTLAERSKQLGLEPVALQLLDMNILLNQIDYKSLIKPQKGLLNEEEIKAGIKHIIADRISKDSNVLDFLRERKHRPQIRILSSKSPNAEKEDRKAFVEGKSTQNFKYENYYQLNVLIHNVAAHQVMALNRGEKQKVLTVKIQIPIGVKKDITKFIWNVFFNKKYVESETYNFLRSCVEDSYDRLIEPYFCRQIRTELTKNAEKESINVFGSNVRSLLLTPPVRGKTVIGIDPGFAHGCKVACVSSKGEVLATDVIYPHSKNRSKNNMSDAEKIKRMVLSYRAEIIAIGNGTACRETEVWFSDLIKFKVFQPYVVKYCIVNENGASIYSVTKEAEAEFPNMDPNLRSAVSIARRLQDPLLEYVKIEPKHLGVGMYQHDVSEAQLKKTLDGIVEECVSFVGVDLNVCPEIMLRKISGLSAARAKQIVEWRNKHSCFVNREQLLEVKGLGQKSYEQCAGFVKILPGTCNPSAFIPGGQETKKKKKASSKVNPLDRTIIHPESYEIAMKFLEELKADPKTIGQQVLVDKVESYIKFSSIESIASNFLVSKDVMQLIIDALKQLQDYDIRKEFDQPLFRTSIRSFEDLQVGQELTGRVNNVTGFGAFVDAGVGTNGLIHISKMKGQKLTVGDKVTVRVLDINLQKKRLALELLL